MVYIVLTSQAEPFFELHISSMLSLRDILSSTETYEPRLASAKLNSQDSGGPSVTPPTPQVSRTIPYAGVGGNNDIGTPPLDTASNRCTVAGNLIVSPSAQERQCDAELQSTAYRSDDLSPADVLAIQMGRIPVEEFTIKRK